MSYEDIYKELKSLKTEYTKLRRTFEDYFNNIDTDNFSSTCLYNIYKPVYAKIEDTDGNVAELSITADALTSQITNAEGSISTLQQTAVSNTSRITSAEGNVSTLQQTATSNTSRIASTEGNVSTLQQTASTLTSRISNAESAVTAISQTVSSISLSASNGTNYSQLTLSAGGTTLSSPIISFSGVVTYSSLSGYGTTSINGNNIMTGTISASRAFPNSSGSHIDFDTGILFTSGAGQLAGLAALNFGADASITKSGTALYINATGGVYINSHLIY